MKISIIVPVYNVENYIEECLNSLIGQTYKNIEIILINDGSTDSSGEICLKYAKEDQRIEYISSKNSGVSQARNTGIDQANGDYIMFVDPDDFIEHDTCEKIIEHIKEADILIFNYNLYKNKRKMINKDVSLDFICSDQIKELCYTILNPTFIPYKTPRNVFYGMSIICNKIFKKELILNNNIRFNQKYKIAYFEDGMFCLKAFNKALTICFYNKPFYNYRQITTSATRNYNPDILKINDNIFREIKQFDDNSLKFKQAYYGRVIRNFRVSLETYFYNKKNIDGKRELKKMLKNSEYKIAFNEVKYKYLTPKLKVYKLLVQLNLINLLYIWYKIEK